MDGWAEILKDNVEFCKSEREAGDAYAELNEFMKEVLKTHGSWEKGVTRDVFGKAVGESAMLTYLSFVLPPLSYGVAFDFLGGNLIASFMQMRALFSSELVSTDFAQVFHQPTTTRYPREGNSTSTSPSPFRFAWKKPSPS
jgi:hypothetical protein